MTGIVFLFCLSAGLSCGMIEVALSPLRKRAGLVFTVLSDLFLALVIVGSHVLILYFLCDGRIFFYAIAAQSIGFFSARAGLLYLLHALQSRLHNADEIISKNT